MTSYYTVNPITTNYITTEIPNPDSYGLESSGFIGSVVSAGYSTIAAIIIYGYSESIKLLVWRTPDVISGTPPPLRLTQRNDGFGVTERHPRINTAGVQQTSSTTSNAISGIGKGVYQ